MLFKTKYYLTIIAFVFLANLANKSFAQNTFHKMSSLFGSGPYIGLETNERLKLGYWDNDLSGKIYISIIKSNKDSYKAIEIGKNLTIKKYNNYNELQFCLIARQVFLNNKEKLLPIAGLSYSFKIDGWQLDLAYNSSLVQVLEDDNRSMIVLSVGLIK